MLQGHAEFIRAVVQIIELVGVSTIGVGAAIALGLFFWRLIRGEDHGIAFQNLRTGLGRAILLGLEFLVAADIINTIIVELTLEAVASLALIVIIRTFLSFSLEVEIEGAWPWQRGAREKPEV